MQVRAEQLSALDVVTLVKLLIDRVGGVSAAAHGQEKHVLAGRGLEGESDRDGTTLASEIGLDAPDLLDGLCGGGEVGVVGRGDPPLAGVHALDLLQNTSVTGGGEGVAPRDQAESVCEAILRHQDVQDKGQVSLVTQLIQLGTLLDNVGAPQPAEWVAEGTIECVNEMYPRKGWSGCFSGMVEQEKELKPYAMVSRIEGFEKMIMENDVTSQKGE